MRSWFSLGLLAWAATAGAESPQPLFAYRVLQKSFRKEPGNTPEKMLADMKVVIPEDIRPWTEISLPLSAAGYNYLNGDTPLEYCQRFDRLGYRFRIEIADPGIPDPPDKRRWFRPEEIREILITCPNCTGVETGETFWAFTGGENPSKDRWLMDVLKVCAAQKRTFLLGEGTWNLGHWTRFLAKHHDELKADGLGRSLLALHKNTKPWATFQNVGALQGAWLTGLVGDYGIWNDEWCWTYSSFGHAGQFPAYDKKQRNHEKVPYTFFLRQWLWVSRRAAASRSPSNRSPSRAKAWPTRRSSNTSTRSSKASASIGSPRRARRSSRRRRRSSTPSGPTPPRKGLGRMTRSRSS